MAAPLDGSGACASVLGERLLILGNHDVHDTEALRQGGFPRPRCAPRSRRSL